MAIAQTNTQILTKQSALILPLVPTPSPTQALAHTQVHIKSPGSDDGLDDLIRGYTAQKPEERKDVEVVGESKFGELLRKYELYLMRKDYFVKKEQALDGIEDVLAPKDINDFLQTTVVFEDYEEYSNGTGKFISRLIQNSYHAGYNHFVINTKSLVKGINKLGESFCGLPYRMIYLQVDGDVGRDFGFNANLSYFIVNGNTGSGCGFTMYNSFFIVNGSVGEWCGSNGRYSSFIVKGYVNKHFSYGAKNCSFTINEVDFEHDGLFCFNSESCTFKTSNKRTLNKLFRYVPKCKDHKVYFIKPDGTEELKREDKLVI